MQYNTICTGLTVSLVLRHQFSNLATQMFSVALPTLWLLNRNKSQDDACLTESETCEPQCLARLLLDAQKVVWSLHTLAQHIPGDPVVVVCLVTLWCIVFCYTELSVLE